MNSRRWEWYSWSRLCGDSVDRVESAVSFKQFQCLNLGCTIVREEIVKKGWEILRAEDRK